MLLKYFYIQIYPLIFTDFHQIHSIPRAPCTLQCLHLPLHTPDSDGEVPDAAEVVGAGDVAEDGVAQVVGDDHGVVGHRANLHSLISTTGFSTELHNYVA